MKERTAAGPPPALLRGSGFTRRRRGQSLIEILVVLVVLVVGIFGVMLLFPGGFASIGATNRSTAAGTLARATEEFFRTRAFNLPEGIVAIVPGSSPSQVDPNLDPRAIFTETAYQGPPAALTDADPRFSGPNRWRYVLGETVKIPPPSDVSPYVQQGTGSISIYSLNFSPIYSAAPIPGASLGLTVSSATPLRRVVLTANNTDPGEDVIQDSFTYGINYDTNQLYFRAVPQSTTAPEYQNDRIFKLSYTYFQISQQGQVSRATSVPNLQISVPWKELVQDRGWNGFALPAPIDLPSGYTWKLEPGSDRLYPRFRQITDPSVAFSSGDPMEYRVLNPTLGLLGFNPLAANVSLPHTSGRGITAQVDYDVDDWQILREEFVVPTDGVSMVKLAGAPLKKAGDTEEDLNLVVDQSGNVTDHTLEYRGLIRGYQGRPSPTDNVDPNLRVDVIVEDLATGLLMDSLSLRGQNGTIDYRAGVIRFNPTVTWAAPGGGAGFTTAIAGRNVRVYYRGDYDWGVAVEKPFTNYLRQSQSPQQMSVGQYFQDNSNTGGASSGGFLFFPITDGGQNVFVDYSWQQLVCDQNNQPTGDTITRTEVGELHQIQDPQDLASPQNLFGVTYPNWWIRLDNHESLGGNDPPVPAGTGNGCGTVKPGSLTVLRVRGASFLTRVFWREGQSWRHFDQTAMLTGESR